MRTLLLGMGNAILTDDAVGVRLAGDLGRRLAGTPALVVVPECSVGGLNLLDVVAGFERLVVVDSIHTAGGVPGTWYHLTGAALNGTVHLSNVHDANFATALELGRRLGLVIPRDEDIDVFAVEVEDDLTFGERLSPRLEAAYPRLLEEILAGVRTLLAAP
jgi:hydrogenase maturation protease